MSAPGWGTFSIGLPRKVFDLLGDQIGTGDDAAYVIRPVELKAWEVPLEWKKTRINRSMH